MTKLIDLLNELAVAEAESREFDKMIDVRIESGANEEEIYELEAKSDNLYLDQFEKFKAVLKKLQEMTGIEEDTARAMIIGKRSELVKIASMEG